MKINQMYKGEFRLKNSLYPEIQLKDWPTTVDNIKFLEQRLAFYLRDDTDANIPKPMIQGVAYKLDFMKKKMREKLCK